MKEREREKSFLCTRVLFYVLVFVVSGIKLVCQKELHHSNPLKHSPPHGKGPHSGEIQRCYLSLIAQDKSTMVEEEGHEYNVKSTCVRVLTTF